MNNLFTYISAIKEESNHFSIIEKAFDTQVFEDDETLIENDQLLVKFSNGVTVKKLMERELSEYTTDSVCEECWISYEVIDQPSNLNIAPKKKTFTNQCQEAFWLKMNKVQLSA